jgi:hypothetical protein
MTVIGNWSNKATGLDTSDIDPEILLDACIDVDIAIQLEEKEAAIEVLSRLQNEIQNLQVRVYYLHKF